MKGSARFLGLSSSCRVACKVFGPTFKVSLTLFNLYACCCSLDWQYQVPAMSIMCNNKEDTDEQRMRRRRRRTYTQVLPKSHKFATIVELSMVPGRIAMGFICM